MAFVLRHRAAILADVPLLAEMNKRLIVDQDHRNPMSVPELETRMRDWLLGDYVATLFTLDGQLVAYALWRDEPEWLHLRHFYVARELRRQGIGREAIRLLAEEVWPPGKRARVSVLVGNQPGLAFWRSVGFVDYDLTLEMERGRQRDRARVMSAPDGVSHHDSRSPAARGSPAG
jgi:GNAT superfamily N-acetyltransferase